MVSAMVGSAVESPAQVKKNQADDVISAGRSSALDADWKYWQRIYRSDVNSPSIAAVVFWCEEVVIRVAMSESGR